MNQQEFMADFFPKNVTVTVDANELQAILRDKEKAESLLESHKLKIEALNFKVEVLNSKVMSMELDAPITVKLDVKV